ncbi:uncharacterized protein LOC117613780, partial [Prunus dulcis]|uniref:uncharacterized protein LOC117613780 n=1 Tax=Prunus dulcis TaxID=3755 RepID=UPI001482D5C5
MFAFGLWRLWKCRNLAVFEGTIMDPAEVVSCLLHQVAEFQDVQHSDQTPSTTLALVTPSLNVGWHKPPVGMVKINCDPAWMAPSKLGGVGWVLRDNFGILIGASGKGRLHDSSALMVEALAIRAALIVCYRMHFWDVVVESDAQRCIVTLNGECEPNADIE